MFGPILRATTLTLAPLRLDDLEQIRLWFAEQEVTRNLLHRHVLSSAQEQEWYDRAARATDAVFWGLMVDGQIIGTTSLSGIDWINRHAGSGTVIGERSQWGKGYGSQSVALRTAYAFNELGLEKLETETRTINTAMQRCLEKSGYQQIGVRRHHLFVEGGWQDTVLYDLLRADWIQRA